MKKLASIVLIISMLSPQALFAQEDKKAGVSDLIEEVSPDAPANEQNVGASISPMRKGQIAPFTGVLLSPVAVATLMTELNSKSAEIELEVNRALAGAQAKCAYEKSIMSNQAEADRRIFEANIEAKTKQIKTMDDALQAHVATQPNPALWTLLGIAAGVVFTTATAAVVVSVSN